MLFCHQDTGACTSLVFIWEIIFSMEDPPLCLKATNGLEQEYGFSVYYSGNTLACTCLTFSNEVHHYKCLLLLHAHVRLLTVLLDRYVERVSRRMVGYLTI